MNDNTPFGASLFDTLAMIIPGGLIVGLIADLCKLVLASYTFTDYALLFYGILFVVSYLVGLVWNAFMDLFFRWFRNCEPAIEYARSSLDDIYPRNNDRVVSTYIKDYYTFVEVNTTNTISILETQVAFIRNMLLVVFFYGIRMISSESTIAKVFENGSCKVGLFLVCLSFALFIVMLVRQHKIYYLILEKKKFSEE